MEDQTSASTDNNSQSGNRVRRKRVKRSRSRRPGWRRTLDRWTSFDGAEVARVLGFLIEGVLIAMILLAPLPLGSVSPWARTLLFLGACLLLFLWVLRASLLGRLEIVRSYIWIFVGAYLLILCFQLIPLPHSLLASLSPKAAELYTALVPGYPGSSGLESLSMNPNATVQEVFRVLTFAIVLFVFLNHFRDRRQIAGVLWAMVALGLFQSFYGLAEKFSGNPHIFWITPRDTVSVHGTYYNRNHFAGLMEMLTPAVFGLFLASLAGRSRSWRASQLSLFQRIEQAMSKGRAYTNVLLGLVVAAMFLAGVLSLSRGGTTGLLIGFLILFSFTREEGGGGRGGRTARVFVLVLLVALGLLFYRGVEGIVDRFEQLTEDDSSWEGRKELREAGTRMFGDFPLLGVGGGAFRYVFPAYQPERYGDRVARYVHNDWLQVACETGVLGAAVAYVGIGVFLLALLRRMRSRQDPSSRLIFAGAFAGVVAMLVHSLVDFNLYMVTANGLIFTVLLGVCHTAVYMKGRTRGSRETFPVKGIEIPGKSLRIGLTVIVLAVCLGGSILSVRGGLADVAFNRYQTWAQGEPELYFFWQPPRLDEEGARQSLARALDLQPCSPEYHFTKGLDSVRSIQEKVLAKARERARALYREEPSSSPGGGTVRTLARDISKGLEGEAVVDEESEAFQELVSAFIDPAKRQIQEEILADLSEAAAPSFRKAMGIAPAVPWYRMSLAMGYASLLPTTGRAFEAVRPEVDKLVEEALALAPGRPASLFQASRYYARGILGQTGGLDVGRERDPRVLGMFEKALHTAPGTYALPTYAFLVDEARIDPGALFEITPDELSHQQRLLRFYIRRGIWPEALTAAENVLVLLGIDPRGSEVPPEIDPDSLSFRLCHVTTLHQMRILQRLGMAEPWRVAEERCRRLLRLRCASLLGQASRYARLARLTEAKKSCMDCLERDWNNLGAFLTLTEIRLLPGASRGEVGKGDLFQDLLRLERANPAPAREECERLATILRQLTPEMPTDHLKARLAEALKDLGCGDPEGASRILKALLLVEAKPFVYWHQRHLLHYHLGRSLEMMGSTVEAVSAYEDALGLAPSHRPSLERLVALGLGDSVPARETRGAGEGSESSETEPAGGEVVPAEEPEPETPKAPTVGERLLALSPEIPWEIDLSGEVTFLGITLEGAGVDQRDSPGFTARYLWEVSDDLDPRDYYVAYRYLDADGNLVYRAWRTLFPEPESYGQNLDGGIGTVLGHWDYLPFPPEILEEVRILVRQKRKGKAAPPPLASISGDRWLTLGLPL